MRPEPRVVLPLVLLASVATFPRADAAGPKPKKSKLPPATAEGIVDGKVGEALDAWMTDEKRWTTPFSGCVLVAKDGKIVLEKGYGLADADAKKTMPANAIFDWCSISKQFTAAAVLTLEMKKKLKIEDSIKKHFDDVPKEKEAITIRHLLNHTSGLGHSDKLGQTNLRDRTALVRCVLDDFPMAAEPGEKFEYSNVAYMLLGALVEQKAKMPFERYVREALFEPAGMKDSGNIGDTHIDYDRVPLENRGHGVKFAYGPELSWGYRGCGGIVAPVRDMLLWDEALRGDDILSKKMKEKYYDAGLESYALGLYVDRAPGTLRYHHSGHTGELVTWYERRPDDHVVVAIASTGEPTVHPQTVAQSLTQILANSH